MLGASIVTHYQGCSSCLGLTSYYFPAQGRLSRPPSPEPDACKSLTESSGLWPSGANFFSSLSVLLGLPSNELYSRNLDSFILESRRVSHDRRYGVKRCFQPISTPILSRVNQFGKLVDCEDGRCHVIKCLGQRTIRHSVDDPW